MLSDVLTSLDFMVFQSSAASLYLREGSAPTALLMAALCWIHMACHLAMSACPL